MRKLAVVLFFLMISACLTGCTETVDAQFFAMDTVVTMELTGKDPALAADLAQEEILRLDGLLSISGDSEIAQINAGAGVPLSPDTAALLRQALEIAEATGGAYDCTIQPAVKAWGWYGDTPAVPAETELADAMALVGYDMASLTDEALSFSTDGMGVDLGGIAKGYAAGRTADILTKHGVTSGWISLGGNIRTIGAKPNGQPWTIGIADPDEPAAYRCTVAVTDCAVVTSGDYQRCFAEGDRLWHHILDPETGYSADNGLRSVTIVCDDDTLADGLSTALFVMGPEKAADFWRTGPYVFDAVFITDSQVYVTEGLAPDFTCRTSWEVISR